MVMDASDQMSSSVVLRPIDPCCPGFSHKVEYIAFKNVIITALGMF